jgi:vacuolar-type H+-ATPase subunit D/Vma8
MYKKLLKNSKQDLVDEIIKLREKNKDLENENKDLK